MCFWLVYRRFAAGGFLPISAASRRANFVGFSYRRFAAVRFLAYPRRFAAGEFSWAYPRRYAAGGCYGWISPLRGG
jgi:hypothetical protein